MPYLQVRVHFQKYKWIEQTFLTFLVSQFAIDFCLSLFRSLCICIWFYRYHSKGRQGITVNLHNHTCLALGFIVHVYLVSEHVRSKKDNEWLFVFDSCSFRLLYFLLLYGYAYICSIFYTNVLRMYYFSFCPLPKIVLSPFRCFRLSLFDRNQSHTLFNNIIEGSRKPVFDWQYPYATDYFPTMNPRYSLVDRLMKLEDSIIRFAW